MSLTKFSMQPTLHFNNFARLFKKITIWIHDAYQSLSVLFFDMREVTEIYRLIHLTFRP
jgi:hypothetical protein